MPKMEITNLKYDIDQNPQFFIEKFKKVSEINKWSEEQKCLQFCLVLPKEAEKWYCSISEETKNNFESLCEAFAARFEESQTRSNLYAKFVSSHQQGQTITEYVENVMAIGKRIEKNEKEIVDQIIHGLEDKFKQLVMIKEPSTVQDIIHIAKLLEDTDTRPGTLNSTKVMDHAHKSYHGSRQRNNRYQVRNAFQNNHYSNRRDRHTSSGQYQHPTRNQQTQCASCGKYNHASSDCWFKSAKCNKCGKMGHIARTHFVNK